MLLGTSAEFCCTLNAREGGHTVATSLPHSLSVGPLRCWHDIFPIHNLNAFKMVARHYAMRNRNGVMRAKTQIK